jgi:hypothetical protein
MLNYLTIPPSPIAIAREYRFCAKSAATVWGVPQPRSSSITSQVDIAMRVLMDCTSSDPIGLEEMADFEAALRLPPAKIKARMLPRS